MRKTRGLLITAVIASLLVLCGCAKSESPDNKVKSESANSNVVVEQKSGSKQVPSVPRVAGNFVRVKPIKDYSDLTIGFRVAQAPVGSGAIKRFFTFPEFDDLLAKLLPHQYKLYLEYRPTSPQPSITTATTTDFVSVETSYGGFNSSWELQTRMLLSEAGGSTNTVSPGLIPIPPPNEINYPIRVFGSTMKTVKLVLKRSGNVMPRFTTDQTKFYDCWEYESSETVNGGEIKPILWVERTTGVVVGGIGDFPKEPQGVWRIAWVQVSLHADGNLRTLEEE